MEKYLKLQKLFLDKNCILLSTPDDISKQSTKIPKVRFVASCGHDNSVFTNVFVHRGTGVVCKECIIKRYKETEYTTDCKQIEYDGFKKLAHHIEEDFECRKLCEGTLCDYAIRPKHSSIDAWLSLQLKHTLGQISIFSNMTMLIS